jgi:ABC-type transport system substrate-binding protein
VAHPAIRTLTCACALLLACNGKQDGKGSAAADTKKVFHYFRTAEHKSLDPVQQFDSASAELVSNVYDTLLQYKYLERPYALEPLLLTKMPELGADGITYSFELRKDVRFADDPCFAGGKGRTLTSDDVIYSIKRFADANLNVKSYVLMQDLVEGMDEFREQTKLAGKATDYAKLAISGLTKVDDTHFTLKLKKPNHLALLPLAASQLSIVPREAVEHYKDAFESHPVGSGPFVLKTLARRGVTVLERNPGYHGTYPTQGAPGDAEAGLLKAAGAKLPLVDRVELPLIEEPQPAMLKFLSGQLDWIGMDRDNFVKMAFKDATGFHLKPEYASKFAIYNEPALSMDYIAFNLDDKLLGKNKALRQAIAYALDTGAYIEQMRNGRGVPLTTLVPIPIPGSQRDLPSATWYEPDLEKAKQKLVEAGYPGGKGLPPLVLEYRSSNTMSRQEHEFRRAQLAKIGVTLDPNFQTFSNFLQRTEAGNFQLASAGWQADYPDAENFYQLLYSKNKRPGPNYSNYANPEYDKLFEQSRFMPNGPERFALFAKMAERIREDVPITFIWTPITVGLHQRWVKNLKRHMMVDAPFKYVDVDPAQAKQGVK